MKKYFCLLISFIVFIGNTSAQEKGSKVAVIGFYNLENMYDTLDAPNIADEEFTPNGIKKWDSAKYQDKISHMASVISQIGTDITADGLAILGVSEIENRSVLEDIVKQESLKSRDYHIVHFDSPDKRGVDVGFIYQPKYFKVTKAEPVPAIIYNDKNERVYTRDILHVTGLLDGEEVHILVNHWPSRRGGQAATAHLRNAVAKIDRRILDSLVAINPNVKFITMGDLNDDPIDSSVKNYLRAHGTADNVKPGNLFDPMTEMYKSGKGTLAFNDTWSLFDQIIISYGLLKAPTGGFKYYKGEIFNKKFLIQKTGNYVGYPMRTFDGDMYISGYSDHFPVYLIFAKPIK